MKSMKKHLINELKIAKSCRTCGLRKRSIERLMQGYWYCPKVDAKVDLYFVCKLYKGSESYLYTNDVNLETITIEP